MVARNAPLNAAQLAILTWVGDGCAQGVYEGWSHRLVARALHHRGLIVVKGHGATWAASITPEGTHYLEHGEYPSRDRRPAAYPYQDDVGRRPAIVPPAAQRSREQKPARPSAATSRPSPVQKQGPVDRLMSALQEAADHRIIVPTEQGARYRQLAGSAKRFGRIPQGMRLSFAYTRQDVGARVAITLEPPPEWQTRALIPLHGSKEVRDPSDVVQAIMDNEAFAVCGEPRNRAFRLLDALVTGARESGMTVSTEAGQQKRGRYRQAGSGQDEILFTIDRDEFRLRFTQDTVHRPHEPTERELARARRGYMFPDFDDVPDERLGMVLEGPGGRFWADRWKDTDEHRLEDDLAQVLEEIRLRHGHLAELREKERERQRLAQQERVEREKRLAAAGKRAAVAHREHLIDEEARDQARRWTEATQLRAYAAEVGRRAVRLAADDGARARQWAERITAVADALDPFPDHAVHPRIVAEPTASDLQAFMNS